MTGGAALATDKSDADAAIAAAKAAQQAASAVGGEWRDTGKLIGEAEKSGCGRQLRHGCRPRQTGRRPRHAGQGSGTQPARRATRSIFTTEFGLTAHENPAPVAGFCAWPQAARLQPGIRIRPHTRTARLMARNTDAELMSLARPDSLWCSGPKRSTVASIAELSSSTTITNSQLPTNRDLSAPLSPSHRPSGSNAAATRALLAECRLVAVTGAKPLEGIAEGPDDPGQPARGIVFRHLAPAGGVKSRGLCHSKLRFRRQPGQEPWFHRRSSSRAARTSSSRLTGRLCGAVLTTSGVFSASD